MQRSQILPAGTRHPFRRSLGLPPVQIVRARDDDGDMKLFVLSFTAFFVCFYTLIA